MAVRPQPRQISSKSVEHTATHGESVATKAFCDVLASLVSGVSPSGVARVLLILRRLALAVRPLLEGPGGKSDKRWPR